MVIMGPALLAEPLGLRIFRNLGVPSPLCCRTDFDGLLGIPAPAGHPHDNLDKALEFTKLQPPLRLL
jgi:hypothetical protein